LLTVIASATTIYLYHHKTSINESYRAGARLFWPLIWVAILECFAIFGAFVMLVIPGIWLAVGFILVNFTLVLEGKRGMNALAASREYVRGYWWATFGRLIVLTIITVGCYIIIEIPFVIVGGTIGQAMASLITLLFVAPFSIAYHYVLYQNFTMLKPTVQTMAGEHGRKTFIVAAQIVGIAFIALIITGVFAAGVSGRLTSYRDFIRSHYGSEGFNATGPIIVSLAPTSGSVGTKVTIYGIGFAATDTVELDGNTAGAMEGLSSNGTMITFTVPTVVGPYCRPGYMCAQYLRDIMPDTYQVSVITNDGGDSNTLPFTVTSR
jgi:hypothetical protein